MFILVQSSYYGDDYALLRVSDDPESLMELAQELAPDYKNDMFTIHQSNDDGTISQDILQYYIGWDNGKGKWRFG